MEFSEWSIRTDILQRENLSVGSLRHGVIHCVNMGKFYNLSFFICEVGFVDQSLGFIMLILQDYREDPLDPKSYTSKPKHTHKYIYT